MSLTGWMSEIRGGHGQFLVRTQFLACRRPAASRLCSPGPSSVLPVEIEGGVFTVSSCKVTDPIVGALPS